MNAIKVDKYSLIKTMQENLAAHQEAYHEAWQGYKIALIAEIETMLADAHADKLRRFHVALVGPVSHAKDYQRVIAMLDASVDTHVMLEEHDFQQYVQDEWTWKEQFSASNALYSGKKG